jgi:hypothetical protein
MYQITGNGLWYGVVRDYEAISYQFTPTFFTSHKLTQTHRNPHVLYHVLAIVLFFAFHLN